jgi:hypothetical protein
MADGAMIVCTPTAWGDSDVPGAEKVWCALCAEEVWISPSSREVMKNEPRYMPTCMPCAMGTMETDDDVRITMHPRTAEELKQQLGVRDPEVLRRAMEIAIRRRKEQ